MHRTLKSWLVFLSLALLAGAPSAQVPQNAEYLIGAGDMIRIVVFQNPDLSLETRLSEGGTISYPLLGTISLGGLTASAAEQRIAKGLRDGGFVTKPQVNIAVTQILGNRVAVLGMVGRPGRVPLENTNTTVSELLAASGGIAADGDNKVILSGKRDGKPYRAEVDLLAIYVDGNRANDVIVAAGDTIYVPRAPMYYIYGEVQRPGALKVERGMTVQQALVQAGGPTARGSESSLRLHRADKDGKIIKTTPELFDAVKPNDVIFVRESLF